MATAVVKNTMSIPFQQQIWNYFFLLTALKFSFRWEMMDIWAWDGCFSDDSDYTGFYTTVSILWAKISIFAPPSTFLSILEDLTSWTELVSFISLDCSLLSISPKESSSSAWIYLLFLIPIVWSLWFYLSPIIFWCWYSSLDNGGFFT